MRTKGPTEANNENTRVMPPRPPKDASKGTDDFEIGPRHRKRAPSQREEKISKRKRKSRNEPAQCVEIEEVDSLVWTEKHKPSESQPFVGNAALTEYLRDWLTEWKTNPVNRVGVSHSSDSEASAEGAISNCMLLHGPPGSGKTSVVYYMAQELGYKVIEVNASSERPGKKILAQLQEATQSHHVEGTKALEGFQTLFANQVTTKVSSNSEQLDSKESKATEKLKPQKQKSRDKPLKKAKSEVGSNGTLKQFFSPRVKGEDEEDVVVVEKQEKVNPKSTMLDYFSKGNVKNGIHYVVSAKSNTTSARNAKKNKCTNEQKKASATSGDVEVVEVKIVNDYDVRSDKEVPSVKRSRNKKKKEPERGAKHQRQTKNTSCQSKMEQCKGDNASSTKSPATAPAVVAQSGLTYSSLTVILFDDVDVVFPQDEGFWSAVETFLSQTKKPVIFTTTRHLDDVQAKLPSHCLSIKTAYPSVAETRSFLQGILTKEKALAVPAPALDFLVQYNSCDLRQCLLQLQFETAAESLECMSLTNISHNEDLQKICTEACTELSELQTKYRNLGINNMHFSFPQILPLPLVNTVTEPLNFGALHWLGARNTDDSLNISWLTDASLTEDEAEGCAAEPQDKLCLNQPDKHSPLLSHLLEQLSNMFEAFSVTDIIHSASSTALGVCATSLPSERRQDSCHSMVSVGVEDTSQALLLTNLSEAVAFVESGMVKQVARVLRKSLPTGSDVNLKLGVPISDKIPCLANFETAVQRSRRLRNGLKKVLLGATSLGHSLWHKDFLPDYMSALHQICSFEQERKDNNLNRSRRFLHYLNSCGVFLSGDDIQTLCHEWTS